MARNKNQNPQKVSRKSKSPRGPNFSLLEKTVLLSCINSWKKIVESNRTGKNSQATKAKAWEGITEEYAEVSQAHGITVPRTTAQIQAFWKAERAKSRNIDSGINKYPKKTGGGGPLELDSATRTLNALVHNIQPALNFTLQNKWDSTGQYEEESQSESEEPNDSGASDNYEPNSDSEAEDSEAEHPPEHKPEDDSEQEADEIVDLTVGDYFRSGMTKATGIATTSGANAKLSTTNTGRTIAKSRTTTSDDTTADSSESTTASGGISQGNATPSNTAPDNIVEPKRQDISPDNSPPFDDYIPPDERDEDDLVKLQEQLAESARKKRMAERAALRENLLNELAADKPTFSGNKKDSKPSKNQRKMIKKKVYGNSKIAMEKIIQTLKRTQPAEPKKTTVSGKKQNLVKDNVSKKLGASPIQIEANQPKADDESLSPSKVLAERVGDSQDNYDSDIESPGTTAKNNQKPVGILEKRIRKCQENCDPNDDTFIKRVKWEANASNAEQDERLRRIAESRQQQEEIHKERMAILAKEKEYWFIKVETANIAKDSEIAKIIGKD